MSRRTVASLMIAAVTCALLLATSGCTSPAKVEPAPSQAVQSPETPTIGGPAGMMMGPGLYEQEDGTAVAIGVLRWATIEGGFWTLVDEMGIAGPKGATLAVVSNIGDDDAAYKELEGTQVIITGKKAGDVSVRQAGPEIEAESIEPYGPEGDTPIDPAQ